MPYPDIYDSNFSRMGCQQRFASEVAPVSKKLLEEFRQFVRWALRTYFVPLSEEELLDFDKWIESTTYNDSRKAELRRVRENFTRMCEKYYTCKSFSKAESYPDVKYPRAINSRTDQFKIFTGPVFKSIEQKVYNNTYFIKHIPVASRPAYILNNVKRMNSIFAATDHSKFEAHITSSLMKVCEFQLYSYMTVNLSIHDEFMEHVVKALAGKNECRFKGFTIKVPGSRMSGDMCTSLGNGFTNLMSMLFLTYKKAGYLPDGVVEGDDGLFGFVEEADIPTSLEYKSLGFDIKCQKFSDVGEAGFCGMYFKEGILENIADISKNLCKFGWTDSHLMFSRGKVMEQLLRAKSFSLAYELPYCPVLRSLADYGLRVTHGVSPRFGDRFNKLTFWEKQIFRDIDPECPRLRTPIPIQQYELVEKLFGWSISEQKAVEKYLDGLTQIQPLDHPVILSKMNKIWVDCEKFTEFYGPGDYVH